MTVVFDKQYISFLPWIAKHILSGDLSGRCPFTKSLGGDMIGELGYYLMRAPFPMLFMFTAFKKYIGLSVFHFDQLEYGAFGLSLHICKFKQCIRVQKSKTMDGSLVCDNMPCLVHVGILPDECYLL